MSEANNGQHPFTAENAAIAAPALRPAQRKPKRHNAKHCPLAIRERIVNALAAGDSQRAIARHLRVSPNTVTAVAEQEWKQVEARKARIVAQCERNATLAAERINAKLKSSDDIPLSTLVPVFGVSVDKMTLLRGDPGLTVHHQHHYSRQQELIDAAYKLIQCAKAKVIDVSVPQLPKARDHSEKMTRRRERRA